MRRVWRFRRGRAGCLVRGVEGDEDVARGLVPVAFVGIVV